MARAKPTNSSTVSPFTRSAIRKSGDLRGRHATFENLLHGCFRVCSG